MSKWQSLSDLAVAYRNTVDVQRNTPEVTITTLPGPVPSGNTVGKTSNYLTRGLVLNSKEIRYLRGVAVDALRATWEEDATKDAMIRAAIGHIRRSFLPANPQDDDHRKRMVRRRLYEWRHSQSIAPPDPEAQTAPLSNGAA